MTSLTYAVESVPWIVAGLIAGFFMGRSTVALTVIAHAVQVRDNERSPMPEQDPAPPATKRWRFSLVHVMGAALIGLSVFGVVQNNAQDDATARLAVCQAAYANGFADALDARSKASAESQVALDEWMAKVNAIIQAPTAEAAAQIRRAFADYQAARSEAKKKQEANPYPDPPRDVCKETD